MAEKKKNMKKNTHFSRIMALLLAVLMVLSTGTSTAFAATTGKAETNARTKNAITSQPAETTVTEGETAVFTVGTTGTVRSYQWQEWTGWYWKNISTRNNASAGKASLSVNAALEDNGTAYRVTVKFTNGQTITSKSAKLWVKQADYKPAVDFDAVRADDVTVNVSAPEGAFPEDTEIAVDAVADLAAVQKAVDSLADVNGKVVAAVDITFTHEGSEIQPDVPVTVTMSSDEIANIKDPVIVHIPDYAEPEEVPVSENSAPEEVQFEADSFSVYAVIDESTDEYARATVH